MRAKHRLPKHKQTNLSLIDIYLLFSLWGQARITDVMLIPQYDLTNIGCGVASALLNISEVYSKKSPPKILGDVSTVFI